MVAIESRIAFLFFFAQSPYSFVGQERLEKITWQPSFFLHLFFTTVCVYYGGLPSVPFLRNFAMFVLNLTTVSGCGNHIYALACELIILHDPTKMNVRFLIFSFRVHFIISSRSVFFSQFFFFATWFVFDNGDLKCAEKKWLASADLAVGQPTPLYSIILLRCCMYAAVAFFSSDSFRHHHMGLCVYFERHM